MEAKSVQNTYSNIAVTNKHTAKLHHVGSLSILYVLTLLIGRKLKEICRREFYFRGNVTTESNCMFSRAVSIP